LDILNFFYAHKVVVTKLIPSQAGLGGGSSDAGAFMRLVREVCNLMISIEELAKLGSTIGADIPFFVYDYASANVSGFGEVVEVFEEEALELEIYTPEINCDTSVVYKTFKSELLDSISLASFIGWDSLESKEIMRLISDPVVLNDLYLASRLAYPELKEEAKEGWFFSGSGSSFFRLKSPDNPL
jgi:4-diphosphocytidyl-2-C-methyl-D-erythritol kinase